MDKCSQCGAPVENGKCTYCGAVYNQPVPQYNAAMPQQNYSRSPLPPPFPNQQFVNNSNNQAPYGIPAFIPRKVSTKSKGTALLLAIFLGPFGAHQFYVGKTAKGVLYFFTAGVLFVGWFIDVITILTGNFKDSYGNILK